MAGITRPGQKYAMSRGLSARHDPAAQTLIRGYGGGAAGGGGRQETARTVTQTAPQEPSKDIMGLFTEAMKKFQPGGTFGKREEALLGRAKKKYLASSAQQMVSAGLSGTTVPMAEETKFQEEIGEPTRLGLEDVRTSRLNELLMAKAGYMGGLGAGSTTTQRQYGGRGGGGYGGGGVISGGGDPRTHPSQVDFYRGDSSRLAISAPSGGTDAGFRNIPEGGRITGDYYYPPRSSFTRNVPTLTL